MTTLTLTKGLEKIILDEIIKGLGLRMGEEIDIHKDKNKVIIENVDKIEMQKISPSFDLNGKLFMSRSKTLKLFESLRRFEHEEEMDIKELRKKLSQIELAFVCADKNLVEVAKIEGSSVMNPEGS